jgi:hypothetical protein
MRRDFIFFVIAALLVGLYVALSGGGFPLDDSWIHQVYGRSVGDTFSWSFVPGEPSAASTSPLYTVLLAVGYFFNLPYQLWTHLLGTLALTAAASLGARMAEIARPERAPLVGWLVGLALLLAWHLIWAAASGMETMLFCTFTLLLVYLVWRAFGTPDANPIRSGAIFGAAAALAMTTRPEGILLAGLCGLAMLLRADRGILFRWVGGAMLGFVVLIVPYLVLNLNLAGSVLPNTADAKFVQHEPLLALPYVERLWRMTLPLLAGGQILLVPGALYFAYQVMRRTREDRTALIYLLPLIWCLALIALYAARLPAAYQHGRYVIPVLPGFIVVGVIGTLDGLRWGQRSTPGRVFTRAGGIATVIVFAYFGLVLGAQAYAKDVRIINEEMVANAEWIRDNLDRDEMLAVHDIGAVGYFAPRPIVDIAGLVTPEVVDAIGDESALWAFMRERDARYFMAFPDQVPGRDPDDERLCRLHQSDGEAALTAGGNKMTIYRLAWDGVCPS